MGGKSQVRGDEKCTYNACITPLGRAESEHHPCCSEATERCERGPHPRLDVDFRASPRQRALSRSDARSGSARRGEASRRRNPVRGPDKMLRPRAQRPRSGLHHQRVIVEPARCAVLGDRRGVSCRDVDDEDAVLVMAQTGFGFRQADDDGRRNKRDPERCPGETSPSPPFGRCALPRE